jgi:hypothetical protein
MASSRVLEAVAVTAELCGRTFSPGAAAVFVSDLSTFPDDAVLKALARCRKEVRGVLTVSDVVSRVDDGRPGPEEAWAMLPRDEETTVAWTEEMRRAWAVALPLLESGEDIPARMAFKEAYIKAVADARDSGAGPQWSVSLGLDPDCRAEVVNSAVDKGLISRDHGNLLLPSPRNAGPIGILLETGNARPLLASIPESERGNARAHIEKLKAILGHQTEPVSAKVIGPEYAEIVHPYADQERA